MTPHKFTVVNVIGTGTLPTELALEPLKEDLPGIVTQNDSQQPGIHFQFEEGGPMTTFYTSGKFILRAPSVSELYDGKNKIQEMLESMLLITEEYSTDFTVKNIVALVELDIDHLYLESLAIGLGLDKSEYEPEEFSALIYRDSEYPCTISVFSTGKLIFAGGEDVADIRNTAEDFINRLTEWVPELNHTKISET